MFTALRVAGPRPRLAALAVILGALSACASGADDALVEAAATDAVTDEAAAGASDPAAAAGSDAVDNGSADEGGDDYVVDDCDYDEFVYTPFTDVPDDWPETFPRPEGLVEIDGEVGVGCGRVTVDLRGHYNGSDGRDWITGYGDQLAAAGFELTADDDNYDELLSWTRSYRRGQDWISYGGDFELVGRDREYLAVSLVLTDFPD